MPPPQALWTSSTSGDLFEFPDLIHLADADSDIAADLSATFADVDWPWHPDSFEVKAESWTRKYELDLSSVFWPSASHAGSTSPRIRWTRQDGWTDWLELGCQVDDKWPDELVQFWARTPKQQPELFDPYSKAHGADWAVLRISSEIKGEVEKEVWKRLCRQRPGCRRFVLGVIAISLGEGDFSPGGPIISIGKKRHTRVCVAKRVPIVNEATLEGMQEAQDKFGCEIDFRGAISGYGYKYMSEDEEIATRMKVGLSNSDTGKGTDQGKSKGKGGDKGYAK